MFDKLEDIPFNLDPYELGISYNHGEIPQEIKPYVDGSFFINLAKNNNEKFNIEFITFFDARTFFIYDWDGNCLLYTSPSPRDRTRSRMPSSA